MIKTFRSGFLITVLIIIVISFIGCDDSPSNNLAPQNNNPADLSEITDEEITNLLDEIYTAIGIFGEEWGDGDGPLYFTGTYTLKGQDL